MKLKILFIAAIFILLCSCNSGNLKSRDSREVIAEMSNTAKYSAPVVADEVMLVSNEDVTALEKTGLDPNKSNSSLEKKKIIKDGRISIKTDDITASKKGIDEIVKRFNAYYDTEELQNDEKSTSYELKLRIPEDNFEKILKLIESGKDEIVSKSIHSRDITEEYVDIETRLSLKRDYLKRYKDLLARSSTVKDILAVEENIRILQEEIESKEGRLKYLNDQIAYSTLEIRIYQEKAYTYKPKPSDKFIERLKNSLSKGWASLVSFVLWLISVWPFIIILFSVYLFWNRIIKPRKNKRLTENSKKDK
jgi:hypothetical protein